MLPEDLTFGPKVATKINHNSIVTYSLTNRGLAILPHFGLLVNDVAVDDLVEFEFVGAGPICVQNDFLAIQVLPRNGVQSGPGARAGVIFGSSRKRRKEDGRPLSTSPPHCSHLVVCLGFSGFSKMPLPRSTSSASTSFQLP